MAVRKLLQSLVKGKPYDMAALLKQVEGIRNAGDTLAICAAPTGPNWLGIRNATVQLFPGSSVELPQYYSQQLLEDSDIILLTNTIKQQAFANVVFSGFPPYFKKLVDALQGVKDLRLSVILHGTFSEVEQGGKISEAMLLPLQLAGQSKLQKVGAVRKDVADFVGSYMRVPTFTLHNKCVVPADVLPTLPKDGLQHIGVFGTENFNKNLHNQVAGAAMLSNCRVFVTQPQLYAYLNNAAITGVPHSSHAKFLGYLASMDVNLHLSFSESWGQIAAESMALGVPCLVSSNTNLLDGDEVLKEVLTVQKIDSPKHIAAKLERALAEQSTLSATCKNYVQTLNIEADELMKKFLEA